MNGGAGVGQIGADKRSDSGPDHRTIKNTPSMLSWYKCPDSAKPCRVQLWILNYCLIAKKIVRSVVATRVLTSPRQCGSADGN